MGSVQRADRSGTEAGLHLVLNAGVVELHDAATGVALVEPAVVAVDRRAGLPFRAGWPALGHETVTWPLEHLDRADLEPDPEPRRCLLAHLVRSALDHRPWWDRILRPAVTLVLPPGLSGPAVAVLCSDARFAGAARHVRVAHRAGDTTSAHLRPFPAD